jgi:hypothetical protein
MDENPSLIFSKKKLAKYWTFWQNGEIFAPKFFIRENFVSFMLPFSRCPIQRRNIFQRFIKAIKTYWSEIKQFFTTRTHVRQNKAYHILTGGVQWMREVCVGQLCLVGRGIHGVKGVGWGVIYIS